MGTGRKQNLGIVLSITQLKPILYWPCGDFRPRSVLTWFKSER
jgi:hypothetical protein